MKEIDRALPRARRVRFAQLVRTPKNIRPGKRRMNEYLLLKIIIDPPKGSSRIRGGQISERG
ncbi:hypothetical protein BH20VER3_BH20VER3_01700 [soil metagenome]